MKNNILLVLLFFLIPIIINGQTQEATTSYGTKVILNADGTWKYAEEATTSEGKKVILNADGTWKYAEVKKVDPETEKRKKEQLEIDRNKRVELEAEKIRKAAEETERKRVEAEQKRISDILNRTNNALSNSKNTGTNSTSEGITGGRGNQGVPTGSVDSKVRGEGSGTGNSGISYDLQGRGFQLLPKPKYDYHGEGIVVVEVSVDRSGKVTQATPGAKGSTTLDVYLLTVAKEAALKATFEPKPGAPLIQKGTITYNFILK